jgi:dTDP-4-amino-4,6-dideoxygalactose transaminase
MPFAAREPAEPSHHLAVIVLPEALSRDAFRTALAEAGIQTSVHYPPIHSFSAYASSERSRPLPVTDAVAARIVSLPLYAHMDVEQASEVVSAVLAAAP